MDKLIAFTMIGHQSDREFWYEICILRKNANGLIYQNRAIIDNYKTATRRMDQLADRHNISRDDRAGMYCGHLVSTGY